MGEIVVTYRGVVVPETYHNNLGELEFSHWKRGADSVLDGAKTVAVATRSREPRVFHDPFNVPGDLNEVMTSSGRRIGRARNGWNYLDEGETYKDSSRSSGWDWFEAEELPLIEILDSDS